MAKKLGVERPAENLITLPASVLPLLRTAGECEVKLLIWLYSVGEYDPSEAAKALGQPVSEVEKAAAFLKGAGILTEREQKKAAAPSESRPVYDASVIADTLEKDLSFRESCDEFASIADKVLNRTDYNTLFYLYDFCKLSGPFICTVAQYCVSNGHKDMRYIQKTALSIYDEGIITFEALEEYIAAKERVADDISSLRTLCGMGERALTSKEAGFAEKWFGEWKMPFELVRLSYEKAVDGTGKISFSYMNKVLENWHEAGYTTAEDIRLGDKAKKDENSSFDADDFFMAALKKTQEEGV